MSKQKQSKWLLAFRIAVSLLATAYVALKVYEKWDEFPKLFTAAWTNFQWFLLVSASVLMLANYALEAQKWRIILRPYYPKLKMKRAMVAVFAGMAAGVVTPNRIGEYAGRILYLTKGNRVEAIIATFVDRICQLAITLLWGLFAVFGTIYWMDNAVVNQIFESPLTLGIFIFVSLSLSLIVLVLTIFPRQIASMIPAKWNRKAWVRKGRFAMQNLEFKLVAKVLLLAGLRYFVFASQYVMLMYAFYYQGGIVEAYCMVALIFLGKSVLPVMGILELGVRESVALLVMTAFAALELTAIGSTLMLYLINLLLPTILGVFALQRLNE